MTNGFPSAEYNRTQLVYPAIASTDDRNFTLLSIAEAEGLLENEGSLTAPTDDHSATYYTVLCEEQELVLNSEEVPGFVIALFVKARKPLDPVAYRTGLVSP